MTISGAGGSSLGYIQVGGKVLLAVEYDDHAPQTYRNNFPETTLYHGDIQHLSGDEVCQVTKIETRELDIFDGSPPCQGFSTAGNRIFHDTKNQLFKEYVRLRRHLQPKVFVMANVSGMVKGITCTGREMTIRTSQRRRYKRTRGNQHHKLLTAGD